MTLPHGITSHTFAKVCAIVAVEMVTVDRMSHMIRCGQMATSQVRTFICGNWGGLFTMVFHLGIPGAHVIVVPFPSLPAVPSRGPSTHSTNVAASFSSFFYIYSYTIGSTSIISSIRYRRCRMESGTLGLGGAGLP